MSGDISTHPQHQDAIDRISPPHAGVLGLNVSEENCSRLNVDREWRVKVFLPLTLGKEVHWDNAVVFL